MLELISVLCWPLLSVRVLAVLLRPPSPRAGLPMAGRGLRYSGG